MKQCSKCKEVKPLSEFHKSSISKDGLKGVCKPCKKAVAKIERAKNKDRIREYNLSYKGCSAYKASKRASRKSFKATHPEVIRAEKACYRAGLTCMKFHAHHWSYRDQDIYDIIYMKPEQHRSSHAILSYNQDCMCFVSSCGLLLDTKEKHLDYLEKSGVLGPPYAEVSSVRPDFLGCGGHVHRITNVEFL